MTEPTGPTKPKTKSERIKELLDAGLSSQEVAEKLDTGYGRGHGKLFPRKEINEQEVGLCGKRG